MKISEYKDRLDYLIEKYGDLHIDGIALFYRQNGEDKVIRSPVILQVCKAIRSPECNGIPKSMYGLVYKEPKLTASVGYNNSKPESVFDSLVAPVTEPFKVLFGRW